MSCGAARVSAAPRPRGATHRTQMCLDPLREEERRENVDVGGRGGRVGGGEAAVLRLLLRLHVDPRLREHVLLECLFLLAVALAVALPVALAVAARAVVVGGRGGRVGGGEAAVLRRRGAAGGRVGEGAHALGGALAAVGAGGGSASCRRGWAAAAARAARAAPAAAAAAPAGREGAGCARRDRDGGHGVPAAPAGHHRRRDARRREADREAALLLLRQQGGAARRRRELRGGARRGRRRLGPRPPERLFQRVDADLRLELRDQLGFVDLARLVRLQQRAEVGHAGRRVEEADERAGVDRARGGAGGGGGRRRGRAGSAHIVWRAWTSA